MGNTWARDAANPNNENTLYDQYTLLAEKMRGTWEYVRYALVGVKNMPQWECMTIGKVGLCHEKVMGTIRQQLHNMSMIVDSWAWVKRHYLARAESRGKGYHVGYDGAMLDPA